MNNSRLIVRVVNIILKVIFYTFFYLVALYFSSFLLDEEIPVIGSKIYISFGCALVSTFIPLFDSMKEFIDNHLKWK